MVFIFLHHVISAWLILCNNHVGVDVIHPMILRTLGHQVFITFEEFVDDVGLLFRRTRIGKT